ncbi:MAG: hypothetical protein KGL37_03165, partial [Acidobacteriota bacterium]|nr:hypothetical protein [Acidobacteriota bacterium]
GGRIFAAQKLDAIDRCHTIPHFCAAGSFPLSGWWNARIPWKIRPKASTEEQITKRGSMSHRPGSPEPDFGKMSQSGCKDIGFQAKNQHR